MEVSGRNGLTLSLFCSKDMDCQICLIVGLLVPYYGVSCPDVILVGKELVGNEFVLRAAPFYRNTVEVT